MRGRRTNTRIRKSRLVKGYPTVFRYFGVGIVYYRMVDGIPQKKRGETINVICGKIEDAMARGLEMRKAKDQDVYRVKVSGVR